MNERLLQYIWQFQLFSKQMLATTEEESLQVVHPGFINTNQGPDFLNAKIKIEQTTWAGNIELHVQSSDWLSHQHGRDKNYNNVILHVVWQNNIDRSPLLPTLVLEDKVPKLLLAKYNRLMNAGNFIACEKTIQQVSEIIWVSWKERLLIERLQAKTQAITSYLKQNNNHWEETLWWLMAKNFGMKVNSVSFEQIARSIPVNILARQKNQIHQIEALLFGQAGLLNDHFEEDYPKMLQKEYRFLAAKYSLKQVPVSLMFLRMRPSNFPTIRLAQLAMLIHCSSHLFSAIIDSIDVKEMKCLLSVTANDYWDYHYVFDEPGSYKKKSTGPQMIDNILINTIIPVLFAYGEVHQQNHYKNKALQWLEAIKPEKNVVMRGYEKIGICRYTAFDSQALLQLKNEYCDKKRCLDCAVGSKLLREDKNIL